MAQCILNMQENLQCEYCSSGNHPIFKTKKIIYFGMWRSHCGRFSNSSRVERECETFSFNLSLSFSEQIKALPISSNYAVHQWVNNECCSRWWYSCTAAHLVNVLVELCAEVKVVVLSPTKAPLPCHLIHLLPVLTLYFSIFKPFTGLVLLSFSAATSLIQL